MKILVISSNYTGSGHKSVYDALHQKFILQPDLDIKFIEGFDLNGKFCTYLAKSYGFLSRKATPVWKMVWGISQYTQITTFITRNTMKKRFLRVINNYKPDIILSLHPNYNKSVIDILEKNNLKIPHFTVISDIVTISQLWIDERVCMIFCPTTACKDECIKRGLSPSQTILSGLPIRQEFFWNKHSRILDAESVLNILIISGAEGVGNLEVIAENILLKFNSNVTIVTGKNLKMKNKLENGMVKKFVNRVNVCGYVEHIYNFMYKYDIIVTRGSPNIMLEAVSMNVPFVAFGKPLPQEKGNINFIEKNSLGMMCRSEKEVPDKIQTLIEENFRMYNFIKIKQSEFSNSNSAESIITELKRAAFLKNRRTFKK